MQTSLFRVGTLNGPPIDVPHGQVYLRSQFVQLLFPVINGGLIWNRPATVVVRSWDGQERVLPIVDITRIALLALAGLGLATALVSVLLGRKTSET